MLEKAEMLLKNNPGMSDKGINEEVEELTTNIHKINKVLKVANQDLAEVKKSSEALLKNQNFTEEQMKANTAIEEKRKEISQRNKKLTEDLHEAFDMLKKEAPKGTEKAILALETEEKETEIQMQRLADNNSIKLNSFLCFASVLFLFTVRQ